MTASESTPGVSLKGSADEILNCWKDIAAYLERDVRTAMRWEHTRGLPVHRLPGGPKSAVYASKVELDAWRAVASNHSVSSARVSTPSRSDHNWRKTVALTTAAVTVIALVGAIILISRRPRPPVVIRSIAVLPFQSLSETGQDFYADGMHEALITALASAGSTRVISRTSVMRYRNSRMSSGQIARELNVDALIEGSVLRDGAHVRITAQLIKGENDQHLWAGTYDRDVRDVLALVADVSQAITNEISAVVVETQILRSSGSRRSFNPEALDDYLRAQQAFHSLTRQGFENALPLYRTAIKTDPEFALAWRGLAMTRLAQVWFGNLSAEKALPEAKSAAQEALRLDGTLGEAHGVVGYIALYWDWDFKAAGESLRRAVKLSPNSPMTRHQYADYLLVTGDVQGSLEQVRLGHETDPLSWPPRAVLLYHSLMARQYDSVIAEARKVLAVTDTSPAVHDVIARAFWLQGKHTEALQEWQASKLLSSDAFAAVQRLYRTRGPKGALLAIAQNRAQLARTAHTDAFEIASWFAAAGDGEHAFQWLDLSYSRREPRLLHIVADPFFDPVRSDPRFSALLRRIGIDVPDSLRE